MRGALGQSPGRPSGVSKEAHSHAADQPEKEKTMAMPIVTLRQLFEAGVHFGHNTRRWNPKMKSRLFGVRNGVHIIDLEQTVPLMQQALQMLRDTAASGGRVLFVGTKRQAQERIAEAAKRCGQYYVNHRWLGGMLTNWKTISQSIKRLHDLDEKLQKDASKFTKKELLEFTRDREKLERALGGIKDMGGLPNILFVIDTIKENIAVEEATKLGLPVVAVVDSNSNPDKITFPIPGNDDASRAIELYCDLAAQAVLAGLEAELMSESKETGKDVGEAKDVPSSETTPPPEAVNA
jgi:small subunit ribosomal protein S2